MLARVLFVVIVCMCTFARAEQARPHVFLIQLNAPAGVGTTDHTAVADVFPADSWQRESGACLASVGRSAVQTALLFGTPPLQQGVVHDLDWRRKPVRGVTLAHLMSKAGYQTRFYGAWSLGSNAPYDPKSRGFQQARYFEAGETDTLVDSWSSPKEWSFQLTETQQATFIHLAEGRHLTRESILRELQRWIKSHENTVVVIIEASAGTTKDYHRPARWNVFSQTKLKEPLRVETDWDLHLAIRSIVGLKVEPKPEFTFFHRANWPSHESPEKNRHRGSLVLGNDLALMDGLSLYRAEGLKPDLSDPLDISKHQQAHQKLLTAHAQWWQVTGKALHDPRAFDVGEKDHQAVQLTALDWRVSKIIDSENGALASAAMVYQEKLLAILAGLKNHPDYKEKFPPYSGSWAVNIKRPGRYKITASLLPRATENKEHKDLMKLKGGMAHIRLGRNLAKLNVTKGATAVTLLTDADAGVVDLECWFTGQLALTRELGAFFVEIERVGDKKFDLKAKAAE